MTWEKRSETKSPEIIASIKEEAKEPFGDRWGNVKTGRVAEILRDSPEIEKELMRQNFPLDYEKCNNIGEKYGLGAEEVAALSFTLKGGRNKETN